MQTQDSANAAAVHIAERDMPVVAGTVAGVAVGDRLADTAVAADKHVEVAVVVCCYAQRVVLDLLVGPVEVPR